MFCECHQPSGGIKSSRRGFGYTTTFTTNQHSENSTLRRLQPIGGVEGGVSPHSSSAQRIGALARQEEVH